MPPRHGHRERPPQGRTVFGYETYDWNVVTGTEGDVFDRLMVRLAEAERNRARSLSRLWNASSPSRGCPVNTNDPRVRVPDHEHVYQDMESLIGRFKTVLEGIRVPKGEFTRVPKSRTASSVSPWCPTARANRGA